MLDIDCMTFNNCGDFWGIITEITADMLVIIEIITDMLVITKINADLLLSYSKYACDY